jgi:hypothetical protein
MGPARFCAGGAQQCASLPRSFPVNQFAGPFCEGCDPARFSCMAVSSLAGVLMR